MVGFTNGVRAGEDVQVMIPTDVENKYICWQRFGSGMEQADMLGKV